MSNPKVENDLEMDDDVKFEENQKIAYDINVDFLIEIHQHKGLINWVRSKIYKIPGVSTTVYECAPMKHFKEFKQITDILCFNESTEIEKQEKFKILNKIESILIKKIIDVTGYHSAYIFNLHTRYDSDYNPEIDSLGRYMKARGIKLN